MRLRLRLLDLPGPPRPLRRSRCATRSVSGEWAGTGIARTPAIDLSRLRLQPAGGGRRLFPALPARDHARGVAPGDARRAALGRDALLPSLGVRCGPAPPAARPNGPGADLCGHPPDDEAVTIVAGRLPIHASDRRGSIDSGQRRGATALPSGSGKQADNAYSWPNSATLI